MDGFEPPCEECQKPSHLNKNNTLPFNIWRVCHDHRELGVGMGGVIPQKLKITEILAECEAYGASLEDYEKVLLIEQIALPFVMEGYKKKDA